MTSSDMAEYVAGWAVVGFFVWLFGYAIYQDTVMEYVCIETQTVSKIEGLAMMAVMATVAIPQWIIENANKVKVF